MKKLLLILLLFTAFTVSATANNTNKKPDEEKTTPSDTPKEKVKKGWNFGPLPAIGYNSDLGFQYGALCDVYYYGDGSTYPEYLHKFNVEASWYTKGSGIFHFFYDSKYLIPKTRLTFAASYLPNKMMAFYGFNGYASPYSAELAKENPAYYATDRKLLRILANFQGKLTKHIGWAAGVSYWNYKIGHVQLDKYKDRPSLYDLYLDKGIIRPEEAHGGELIELKLGLVYDTRDMEAAPNRGIWAEAIALGSPDIIGNTGNAYMKLSAHFRQYIPLIYNRLTLAYHLAYQGTIAGNPPFYVQSSIATLYLRQVENEGLGGINTVRGLLLNRMVGDGYAWANAELRWRIFDFRLFAQDWYFATNPFFDAGMVVQPYRLEEMKLSDDPEIYSGNPEGVHMSAGLGVKAVMNHNFIISVEWAKTLDNRDGSDSLNIGLNYIF